MKWFRHDSKASNDAKLQKVLIKYGLEGYGLYWFCLELIASNVEPDNLTFELEHDAEIIAFRSGMHYEKVQEMMTYMIKLGLFEQDKGVITCLRLAKRLDDTMARNPDIKKIKSKLFKMLEAKSEQPQSNPEVAPKKIRPEENRSDQIRLEEREEISCDSDESPTKCPASKIIQLYNKTFPELTQVLKETSQRKTALKARWRENPEMQTIEAWDKFFNHIRKSDFLMGRAKDWKADFDWIVKAANFVKIYEGKYHS